MDATRVASLLEKKIAVLPGSRDRHGGAVIVFPSHGEFVEFPFADVVSMLSYLSQIPDENVRSRGYTIIVDMRHAWIRYLKTILKAIQHVLCRKIRQTIILKPEQFLDKQRIMIDLKLEVYEFKIFLVSLHKLSRHMDIIQLPTIFNGQLPYEHKRWLDLRSRYEAFLREAGPILKSLENQNLLTVDTSNDSNENLEYQPIISSGTNAKFQEFLTKGQKLLDDLKEDDSVFQSTGLQRTRNPDFQSWAQRIEVVLRQIRGKEDITKSDISQREKNKREQTEKMVYEQFLIGVKNISDWLLGPGEKWLLTLHDVGESNDEAEQLKRDYDQLKNKATEIDDQTTELRSIADELLALKHPQALEIQRKRDFLDGLTKTFLQRIERQHEIIRMSVRFHKLIDEFTHKLDDLLENLCSEICANDIVSTQSAIDSLEIHISAIEKAYDEVANEGKHFLDLLNAHEKAELNYDSTRDYLPGFVHVRHMIADLHDRRQRSQELADVRRLKLQQMLQLFTCESDASQATRWIHELCDTLLTQYSKLGAHLDDTSSIRRDHQKLEQTARSTYEYGRQLVQISSVLRRSLRFELSPNYDLAHRIEESWSRFCRGLSERVSRVNLTHAFYQTIKQVSERLERLCSRIGDELEQKSSGMRPYDENYRTKAEKEEILERYEGQRRDVFADMNELRHMGEALIARIEHPVDSKELVHVNHSAIEDIRQRLDQVEKKMCILDSYWSSMGNLPSPEQPEPLQHEPHDPYSSHDFRSAENTFNTASLDALVREMRLLSSNATYN